MGCQGDVEEKRGSARGHIMRQVSSWRTDLGLTIHGVFDAAVKTRKIKAVGKYSTKLKKI